MKKFCLVFLLILFSTSVSAKSRFDEATIKGELRKPGVKLVAIDFYMTGCEPCDAAIPEWKKLKEDYGDSMKLIVVAPQRDDGSCSIKGWLPDKIVCDEDMEIAEQWGVKDFPQAFLYSWHDNDPLVKLGHVKDVRKAIKKYFKTIPRVALDADEESEDLLPMVEEALITNSKIEVVADEDEREELMEIRKESHKLRYDEDSRCELGKEIAANSILKISRQDETLSLKLSSAEKSCTMAAATKILSGNKGKLKTEIASAVYDLLSQMFGDISIPGDDIQHARAQKSSGDSSNFQDALACEHARKESSDFVWKAYLKSYPKGECAAEAKDNLDRAACEIAENNNSVNGWKEYLKEFPNGKCKAKAKAEFDRSACMFAEHDNSVEIWTNYLEDFPEGKCADKAHNFLENYETKDKEACQKARQIKNEKELSKHLRNYLQQYPEGQCAAKARKILDVIACNEAKKEDTLEGWENYLNEYPNGKCAAEAKKQYRKNMENSLKKGRNMKIAGATLLTLGASVFVAGFVVGATTPFVQKDAKTDRADSIAVSGGGIGGTMMLIGVPLLIVGVKKEKEAKSYLEMNNLAVLPQKDGFYATVGFNF